jgi:hypothetical protein
MFPCLLRARAFPLRSIRHLDACVWLAREEMLSWYEFKLCYDSVFLEGQMWLPCGETTAPTATDGTHLVPSEASRASCDEVKSRLPLRKKAPTPHDLRRECFVLQQQVDAIHPTHSNESSTEGGPPRSSGHPGRAKSIYSPAKHKVNSNNGARGASSARGRMMTSGGSGGERRP